MRQTWVWFPALPSIIFHVSEPHLLILYKERAGWGVNGMMQMKRMKMSIWSTSSRDYCSHCSSLLATKSLLTWHKMCHPRSGFFSCLPPNKFYFFKSQFGSSEYCEMEQLCKLGFTAVKHHLSPSVFSQGIVIMLRWENKFRYIFRIRYYQTCLLGFQIKKITYQSVLEGVYMLIKNKLGRDEETFWYDGRVLKLDFGDDCTTV